MTKSSKLVLIWLVVLSCSAMLEGVSIYVLASSVHRLSQSAFAELQALTEASAKLDSSLLYLSTASKKKREFVDLFSARLQEVRPSLNKATISLLLSSVYEYSYWYQVSPILVLAVIEVESRYQIDAKGHSGEVGLMQILPSTMKLLDPDADLLLDNLRVGIKHLSDLTATYGISGRLARYNAGKHWKSSQAKRYVQLVRERFKSLSDLTNKKQNI